MRVRSTPRYAGIAVIIAVAVLVLSPALRASPRDGFPLSNYPMFATDVGREARVDTAVGLRADGSVERLSPRLVTGTDEVILAASTVTNAVVAGPATAANLCAEIAGRVTANRADITQIRLATETYDAIDYFDGQRAPAAVDVHAVCPVP